jgi:hypothetical protein
MRHKAEYSKKGSQLLLQARLASHPAEDLYEASASCGLATDQEVETGDNEREFNGEGEHPGWQAV